MQDISANGLRIRVIGSVTFPSGFDITQLADDTDPFDAPSVQIADKGMGLNGDLVVWSKANPLPLSLSAIPGSDDDRNLQALYDANRVGRNKASARDVVTVTVVYPDGRSTTYGPGAITDGPSTVGVASAGRKKTSVYQFAFEGAARS